MGILSRRPPLQWCQDLHYLTDPIESYAPFGQTTPTPTKASVSFPEHFMKKYEKYLRRDAQHSKTKNSVDTVDKSHPLYNADKRAVANKFSNSKQIYYERLWPKTKNLRKNHGQATDPPETGLTALASFPVSLPWMRRLTQYIYGTTA